VNYEQALAHFGLTDTGEKGEAGFGDENTPILIDKEGVSHPGVLGFVGDLLGFCGCGRPELPLAVVRDVLALHPLYDHRKEVTAYFADRGGDAIEYLVLYLLDDCNLTSHGGGVGGGWLTPHGEAALVLLNHGLATETP
jgi:hypothetical protein